MTTKLCPNYADSVTATSWPSGQKRGWETTTAKRAGFMKNLNCVSFEYQRLYYLGLCPTPTALLKLVVENPGKLGLYSNWMFMNMLILPSVCSPSSWETEDILIQQ